MVSGWSSHFSHAVTAVYSDFHIWNSVERAGNPYPFIPQDMEFLVIFCHSFMGTVVLYIYIPIFPTLV